MRAILFAVAVLAAGPVAAVEDYDTCIALIGTDPERAESEAASWAAFGGGAPARHCLALALAANGRESAAVDELLGIAAEEPDLPDGARADILVQAGEMLVDEGDTETALAVAAQALKLVPGDRAALALSASAHLAAGDAGTALAEIDRALAKWKPTTRLMVLRSAAARQLGDLVAARDNAHQATELAPDSAAAWLERGRVAARLGDRAGARTAFLNAVGLDRDGRLGAAARLALQRMEAGIED